MAKKTLSAKQTLQAAVNKAIANGAEIVTAVEQAKIVKRWTPTWPSRKVAYFDFSPWGGGYVRATGNGPGAIHLGNGLMANIQTGRVYSDARFA
jgi:hypothetical protein